MKYAPLFVASALGVLAGLVSAHFLGIEKHAEPPIFTPAANPYARGIFANGIVESAQSSGSNININPEVSGPVVKILVHEGETVASGTVLLAIDDSVQRAVVDQQKMQAGASQSALQGLKAQPRAENLEVSAAQLSVARASLKTAHDQFDKVRHAYEVDPGAVSKESLDTSENQVCLAQANLDLAQRQYDLTRAGAWRYDVENQEAQYNALVQAEQAASALLAKYTVKAPIDGVVLSVNATVGSYISPAGSYGTYTGAFTPVVVMSSAQDQLGVRVYVDEILVSRLPPPEKIRAEMSIRGTDVRIPLEFVRVQPYVTPKIELSNQREERVDLRVLPLIFRFAKQSGAHIYPGQLVDVYVGEN
jgi:HlyD family secretion protein